MPLNEEILEAVRKKTYKKASLEISFSCITNAEILKLFIALNCNEDITKLELTRCSLGMTGAKAVAEGLATNKTIRVLRLGMNEIGDDGAYHLAEAIKINQTLKSLYIPFNDITDIGVQYLVAAAQQNRNVINIDFNFDHPGDRIVRPIMEQNKLIRKKLALNFLTKAFSSVATEKLNKSPAKALIPGGFDIVPNIADFLYGHGIFAQEKFWQQLQRAEIKFPQTSLKKG